MEGLIFGILRYIESDISVRCVRFKIQGLYYLHILSKLNEFRRLEVMYYCRLLFTTLLIAAYAYLSQLSQF